MHAFHIGGAFAAGCTLVVLGVWCWLGQSGDVRSTDSIHGGGFLHPPGSNRAPRLEIHIRSYVHVNNLLAICRDLDRMNPQVSLNP